MVSLTVTIIGSIVGGLGFMVMRDPMRLALLAPGAEGYYQRLVLDRWQRIGLRVLGVLVSLFGLVILAAALSGLLRLPVLDGVSSALLGLMGLLFVGVWVFGAVFLVVQLIRGRALDYLQIWKRGVELGPIAVYPCVTPTMEKEARGFTLAFCALVGIAVCVGLYHG